MIGLLLVSHSASLAAATEALIRQMTGETLPLKCAAGAGEDGVELGTDASAILRQMEALRPCDAIVVLMDIGSAILSTELACDLADDALRAKIHLSSAPFVEGAIAAGVAAVSGLPVARVLAEAASGLTAKQSGLDAVAPADPPRSPALTRDATIADPHGLHLRPAAAFVKLAAQFNADVTLRFGARVARGDSLMALMALGTVGGVRVTIEATGKDAQAAAETLANLLEQAPAAPSELIAAPSGAGQVPLSPGKAAGRLFLLERAMPAIPDHPATDRDAARLRLDGAIASARATLAGSAVLEAQAALLADPALLDAAYRRVSQEGQNECMAWRMAVDEAVAVYSGLEAPYLRERARDVKEAGDAVLRVLLGADGHAPVAWPSDQVIVFAEDLTAAEAASMPANVLGVLDRRGSATSHATILLRAAGIPALANVILDPIPARIAFDGATGSILPNPDAVAMRDMRGGTTIAAGPAGLTLVDGSVLEFWANVSGERDAAAAARAGAYGIGLARTEILFLDRAEAPSSDEQAARIAAMIGPFAGRPVVVRALDAGADKPVPFLRLADESNPALGVRGIRALLRRKDFFAAHLRAIMRAGEGHDLRIMIPMVASLEEMLATRELLAGICRELAVNPPPVGAMIEVPAAAIRVQDLTEVCDFFSIGTNDLTQYVFAAERGNQALADFADAGHPAILDLCSDIVARAGGRPVSVCGEAAGNKRIAPLLVHAGIRRLSMGAARLGDIRQVFTEQSL
jgi:multiphosphoryl transfer protein